MDAARFDHRNKYPVSANLESLPPEVLEMICRFLPVQDVMRLSFVSKTTYESFGHRVSDIGIRTIGVSLSERRPEEALSMLGSFCQWFVAGSRALSECDQLGVWREVLALAGHACFSRDQQDQAYRQVYFWACPSSQEPTDDFLRLLHDVRTAWFCECFPEGGIFSDANPSRSFTFIAPYLERRAYWTMPDADAVPSSVPPKQVAWLGACIEAIRLGGSIAPGSPRFSAAALKLRAAFEDTPVFFRVTLALDLIECIKRFPPDERAALLPHVEPLIDAADAEEKSTYLLAVHGARSSLHQQPNADDEMCRLMLTTGGTPLRSGQGEPNPVGSVAEIVELERQVGYLFLQQLDDRLQIIALGTLHP